jgi:hypothetical protein
MVTRVKTAMAGPLPAAVAKMKLYMVGFGTGVQMQFVNARIEA